MSPMRPWKTRPVRRARFALTVSLVLIAGCARDDQLSSPLVSSPLSSRPSIESTTTSTSSTTSSTSTTSTIVAPRNRLPPRLPPAPPTEPPTTVAATTSTLAPGACAALPAIPAGAVESSSKLIDVDADGVTDTVRTYSIDDTPTAGDWHVRIELAAGGGVDICASRRPGAGLGQSARRNVCRFQRRAGPRGATAGDLRHGRCRCLGVDHLADAAQRVRPRCDGQRHVRPRRRSEPRRDAALRGGRRNDHCSSSRPPSSMPTASTFDVIDTAYTRSGIDLVVYGSGPHHHQQPSIPVASRLIDCSGVDEP